MSCSSLPASALSREQRFNPPWRARQSWSLMLWNRPGFPALHSFPCTASLVRRRPNASIDPVGCLVVTVGFRDGNVRRLRNAANSTLKPTNRPVLISLARIGLGALPGRHRRDHAASGDRHDLLQLGRVLFFADESASGEPRRLGQPAGAGGSAGACVPGGVAPGREAVADFERSRFPFKLSRNVFDLNLATGGLVKVTGFEDSASTGVGSTTVLTNGVASHTNDTQRSSACLITSADLYRSSLFAWNGSPFPKICSSPSQTLIWKMPSAPIRFSGLPGPLPRIL